MCPNTGLFLSNKAERRESIHTRNECSISALCDPFCKLTLALGGFNGFPWHCDPLFEQADLPRGLNLQLSAPHMAQKARDISYWIRSAKRSRMIHSKVK